MRLVPNCPPEWLAGWLTDFFSLDVPFSTHTVRACAGVDIDMAFNKKKANERKQWLRSYDPAVYVDHSADAICYSEFVHKEVRRARADVAVERAACSAFD